MGLTSVFSLASDAVAKPADPAAQKELAHTAKLADMRAEDFDAIRNTTRQLAHAIGADEQAAALLNDMDATLAELAATAPQRRITVAGWEGGGSVPSTKTWMVALFNC